MSMRSPANNFNPRMKFTVVSDTGSLQNISAPLDVILEAIEALGQGDTVTMEVDDPKSSDVISINVINIMFTKQGYGVGSTKPEKGRTLVGLVYGKRSEVADWYE